MVVQPPAQSPMIGGDIADGSHLLPACLRYAEAGYQIPRLVFWNVNSRSGTIPVKENDLGVALVSGFSPNIAKMVMSGQTDPYDCLLEAINAERYQQVDDALRPIISA